MDLFDKKDPKIIESFQHEGSLSRIENIVDSLRGHSSSMASNLEDQVASVLSSLMTQQNVGWLNNFDKNHEHSSLLSSLHQQHNHNNLPQQQTAASSQFNTFGQE